MTSLSLTCFSALLALPALAASLSGSVQLSNSADPGVRKHKDYSGVVVWLEPMSGQPAPAAVNSLPNARMVQKDKRFIPHVLAVRAGTPVEFPNYDPIFHNAFSNFSGQIFDVGLYPPGSSRKVTFRRSGIVRIFCNIHPAMSGVIAVLDSPWFAVSSASGAFQIQGVPPGEYRLRVFHERATEALLKSLERPLAITEKGAVLPVIAISETGYVEAPHMNKFGHDYPPAVDDNVLYPGARK
jgi:plastocyanin